MKIILIAIMLIGGIIIQNCSNDHTKDLGNQYFYRDEGGDVADILNENSDRGEIPATVINYDYNADFIIAKQKPKCPQELLYNKKYHYKNGNNQIYYWLIIHKENLVLGPMDSIEYIDARKRYDVPDKLKLE